MISLSAMISMVLQLCLNTSDALDVSPASMARRVALMAVRSFERSAELWTLALAAWRARCRASEGRPRQCTRPGIIESEPARRVFKRLDKIKYIGWAAAAQRSQGIQ